MQHKDSERVNWPPVESSIRACEALVQGGAMMQVENSLSYLEV